MLATDFFERRKNLGKLGENLACRYLKGKNYKILNQNLHSLGGEIDILAWDQREKVLVFVEVKTRASQAFGQPHEAVDFFKQKKLIRAVYRYIAKMNIEDDFRVDVIGISLDYSKRIAHLEHLKNAIEEAV